MPKKKEEIFENPSDDELPSAELKDEPSKLPPKKPRKKRVMTDEQKARAIENLKKGRLTAQKNRERRKKLKEIEKAEKLKAEDDKIREFEEKKTAKKKTVKKEPEEELEPEPVKEKPRPPTPTPKGRSNDDYENEIKMLKEKLAEKSKKKLSPIKEEPPKKVKVIDEPIAAAQPVADAPPKKRRACGVRGLSTLRGLGLYN